MSAPVFFAERALLVSGPRLVLDGPEGRHAAAVRRIAVGESVVLTDGDGLAATATVTGVGKDHLVLDVNGTTQSRRPDPSITVVQALPKGDRGELAVELLTEVGVDRVVPWSAARCVTRWRDERGSKAYGRWRSTAREAAKQSRRTWWPQLDPLASTEQVVAMLSAADHALVLHEDADEPLAGLTEPTGTVVLVVGPEGGVSPEELAAFAAVGAAPVRLGPTVMRTSTAGAVAVGVLLSATERWR